MHKVTVAGVLHRKEEGIYGPEHVLVGKRGFESLVNPHKVVNAV